MRTNYVVKTHLQIKFALIMFVLLSSVVIFVSVQSGTFMQASMVRSLLVGLAVTFGLGLFFSHFIAGPIYRFEQTLEQIKDGRLNIHVQLRKYDELKDLADSFNQALSSLRNRLRKERSDLGAIADKIEDAATKLKKTGRTEQAKELHRLAATIKKNPPQIQI